MIDIHEGTTTFAQIDDDLVKAIKKVAGNLTLIDCGAGAGKLELAIPGQVISLDIYPKGDHVIEWDCTKFEYSPGCIPIFLRPCHSDFVEKTLRKAFSQGCKKALYLGFYKNLEIDFGKEYDHLFMDEKDYIGPELERLFTIEPRNITEDPYIKTFVLVEDRSNWWATLNGDKVTNNYGGYQYLNPSMKIIEKVEAHSFDELDWSNTYLTEKEEVEDQGWLSRDGTWYGCEYEEHDDYARFVLKKEVGHLEETGWVRVCFPPSDDTQYSVSLWECLKRLSPEQRNWLQIRGHKIIDSD
jgi:hypothetical protein